MAASTNPTVSDVAIKLTCTCDKDHLPNNLVCNKEGGGGKNLQDEQVLAQEMLALLSYLLCLAYLATDDSGLTSKLRCMGGGGTCD